MALPSQNNESRSGVMHQTGAGISSNTKIGIIAVGLLLAAGGIYALTKFMPAKGTTAPDELTSTSQWRGRLAPPPNACFPYLLQREPRPSIPMPRVRS